MAEREQSRIAVIGSGAVGGFLAAELSAAGHPVMLCVRSPLPRLTVTSQGRTREVPVEIVPLRLTATGALARPVPARTAANAGKAAGRSRPVIVQGAGPA